MKQIFYFDCFALLADDWTFEFPGEPSELMDSPELIGFFASEDAATAHAIELETEREAAHGRERENGRGLHISQRQRSYYIVPVNQLKSKDAICLFGLEDKLIEVVRLMASGIGGAALALPAIETTSN